MRWSPSGLLTSCLSRHSSRNLVAIILCSPWCILGFSCFEHGGMPGRGSFYIVSSATNSRQHSCMRILAWASIAENPGWRQLAEISLAENSWLQTLGLWNLWDLNGDEDSCWGILAGCMGVLGWGSMQADESWMLHMISQVLNLGKTIKNIKWFSLTCPTHGLPIKESMECLPSRRGSVHEVRDMVGNFPIQTPTEANDKVRGRGT